MQYTSIIQHAARWLVVAMFLSFGFAMAQSEPSLNEVYAAAKSGKIDQAQVMMQQVLVSHPKSAKAHFVQSELFARQGDLGRAREALNTAEKLAPGLPFAKPESLQALRTRLSAKSATATSSMAANTLSVHSTAPASPSSPSSWGLPLLLAGGVIVVAYLVFRKRPPEPVPLAQQPVYANQGGLTGPQSFGMGGGGGIPPTYAQPAGSGLGGRIMGGVATGLAVGAGFMAAEAIGKSFMGNNNQSSVQPDNHANNDHQPFTSNTDMGGQNFGVNDANSWDDNGSVSAGGGDWDS
jgi:hypothetical protein